MNDPGPVSLGRRSLLRAAASFAGASLLGGIPLRAFAQAAQLKPVDRAFIFVYLRGGWDQLLALDPKDPTVFSQERISQTRIDPGYYLLSAPFPQRPITPVQRLGGPVSNIQFGPAIGKLQDHYDKMCVVRGINMTTLSHDEGYLYFMTGKRPNGNAARGSSTATEIVAQMVPAVPIPSIAYGVHSYNDRLPAFATALRFYNANDLLLAISPSKSVMDAETEQILRDFRTPAPGPDVALYDSRGMVSAYRSSQQQIQAVLAQALDRKFRFELPENAEVRARYGLPSGGPYESPAGRVALAATAIKTGVSQCISLQITTGLDTHVGPQQTHAELLKTSFDAIGDLVTDLRTSPHPSGGSFLDHTTVLVYSEFGRTPTMNYQMGRDHHLCNSCALIGAGVKHNLVVGASGNIAMAPGRIDLRNGAIDPNGENILPEHIIATILASANLDYSFTRADPLRFLLS
jgi:uncharacterized protein (DUF1501 family)